MPRNDRRANALLLWLIAGLAGLAPACASEPDAAPGQPPAGELTVFAAASLRHAFDDLGAGFRQARPGARVRFHFAGSQQIRAQIEHGAVADVFAAADLAHMEALDRQGLVRPAAVFAHNQLAVVVPRGETRVKTFHDLPAAERIVIGAAAVPVGRYARQVLDKASARWPGFGQDVMARVVSHELNVRQVLAKVALGEADAGIVYRTDAAASDEVDEVSIPRDLNAVAAYPVAVLARAPHPALAAAFIAHLRSARGRQALARAGFAPPAGAPDSEATSKTP